MELLNKLAGIVSLMLTYLAAAGQTYSLNDCIRTALDQNEHLKNSRLEVVATTYNIREVKSALLPNGELRCQYLYYNELPAQYAAASNFGGPEGQYTRLALNMPQTTGLNMQLTQSLFNQSVFIGLQAARTARNAANAQVEVTKESVIYNVAATYYTIQVLSDNLRRLAANIANLERIVAINEDLVRHEIVSANVQNRLSINLENLRNQFESQKLAQEKNVQMLKYLINVDANTTLEAEPFDYLTVLNDTVSIGNSARPDIRLQQEVIKLSEYDKKSVSAGFYPVLTASFSQGWTSYYDEFAPMKQINNDWINSSYFTVTLRMQLFDGFRRASQVRQKEIAIRKNVNTLSMMQANASRELEDANNAYITSLRQLKSSKVSLEQAEGLFNTAQSDYANGIITISDVLNAQNDLSNALNNYSSAALNVKLSGLALRKANGTLLSIN